MPYVFPYTLRIRIRWVQYYYHNYATWCNNWIYFSELAIRVLSGWRVLSKLTVDQRRRLGQMWGQLTLEQLGRMEVNVCVGGYVTRRVESLIILLSRIHRETNLTRFSWTIRFTQAIIYCSCLSNPDDKFFVVLVTFSQSSSLIRL